MIFESATGNSHSRPVPKPAELTADTLNNRAISMLDLGKEEDALQAWRDALSADPKHCATIYNQGLTQWRQSQITDDVLVEQLGSAKETQSHH